MKQQGRFKQNDINIYDKFIEMEERIRLLELKLLSKDSDNDINIIINNNSNGTYCDKNCSSKSVYDSSTKSQTEENVAQNRDMDNDSTDRNCFLSNKGRMNEPPGEKIGHEGGEETKRNIDNRVR